jgi:hypothetical protein
MTIPTAILAVIINLFFQLLGSRVDFPGLHGGLILLSVSFIYSIILCALGSGIGLLLIKTRKNTRG